MCPNCHHWKANHDEMVARNRLLRNRPDLPIERATGYDAMMDRLASLTAEVARLKGQAKETMLGLMNFSEIMLRGDYCRTCEHMIGNCECEAIVNELTAQLKLAADNK